jgi:hypothetical protein
LSDSEQKLERIVNLNLYNPQEFANKVSADSSFLNRVVEQPKIFLIGTEDDIP